MKKKHGRRMYSDGGKVLEREYGAGKPTYLKAVAARLGMGDGYGKAKKGDYAPMMNAGKKLKSTVAYRKKMLDGI